MDDLFGDTPSEDIPPLEKARRRVDQAQRDYLRASQLCDKVPDKLAKALENAEHELRRIELNELTKWKTKN